MLLVLRPKGLITLLLVLRPKGLITVRSGSLPRPPELAYRLSSSVLEDRRAADRAAGLSVRARPAARSRRST